MPGWLLLVGVLAGCGGRATDSVAGSDSLVRVGIIADSHLIDDFYTCCESTPLDTESLEQSEARLIQARTALNALDPQPEILVVAGDVVHEFPSADPAFYEQNRTSMDIAADVYAGFDFPVHLALGNHDYEVPELPRQLTWDLVRSKWGMDTTWSSVDVAGTRWLLLDGQYGPTWDPDDPQYDRDFASFGADQLAWLDQQLADGLPTFLVFHHPPNFVRQAEDPTGPNPDLFAVIDRHGDTVQAIFTGHMHLWMDTTGMWGRPGYGLAATRFDARNWWVMDIDPKTGAWSVPGASEVAYGSFWWDGEQPEPATLRRADGDDLHALALAEVERHRKEGWSCRPLREIAGQGWATGCARPGHNHHVLTATELRGEPWLGFAPQHDYHPELAWR